MALNKIIDSFKKIIPIAVILVILYIVQHFINYLSYDLGGPSKYVIKYFLRAGIEEDLARAIYWYILQIGLGIVCIKIFVRKPLKEVGFNLQSLKLSIRYIVIFMIAYPLIVAAAWFAIYKVAGISALIGGVQANPMSYIIKDLAVFGLLPGPGEEPLFRVFVIQFLLLTAFRGRGLDEKNTRRWIIVLSALIFSYGHIYVVSWKPFIANYNVIQLVTAFGLGIFYAVTYIKTKSILSAIVCHNYSDLIVKLGAYILFSVAS